MGKERIIENKQILNSINKLRRLVLEKGEVAEIEMFQRNKLLRIDNLALSLSFPYEDTRKQKRVNIVNLVTYFEKGVKEKQYLEIISLRNEVRGLNRAPSRFAIDDQGNLINEYTGFEIVETIPLQIREKSIRAGKKITKEPQEEDQLLNNVLNKILAAGSEKTSVVGKKY